MIRAIFTVFVVGLSAIALGLGLGILNLSSWFTSRSVEVAQQQFDPAEMLRKYEWFKDASAALDGKQADIKVYRVKLDRLRNRELEGHLDRVAREQLMVWEQEFAGVKLSYNQLAAEYNSQMAKFNWRFANRGALPAGATEPLPREYKPYQEQ